MITRLIPIKLILTCIYDKITQKSAQAPIKTVLGRIGGLVSRQSQQPLAFSLNILRKDGTTATEEQSVQIPIGETVTAVLSGPSMGALGVRVAATDCFISPDIVPTDDSMKYVLLKDMCPADDAFKIEDFERGQKMTFRSFAFANDSRAKVYLHCDVLACNEKSTCGICMTKWKSISSAWLKTWNSRKRTALSFDLNTFETLSRDNIRCNKDGMLFTATQKNFPNWKASDIIIGTCPLNDNFTLNLIYKDCGIKTKERNHQLIIEAELIGILNEDILVTRKRPIQYTLRCIYDRFTIETSQTALQPETINNDVIIEVEGESPELFLKLLDNQGLPLSSSTNTLPVELNEKVEAVIGGNNIEAIGVDIYASKCFVTPTTNSQDKIKYVLLENSCPIDETFQIKKFSNGQKLSFNSFAFTDDKYGADSMLYLHCDVLACLPTDRCGKCNARNKRSIASKQDYIRLKAESMQLKSMKELPHQTMHKLFSKTDSLKDLKKQ